MDKTEKHLLGVLESVSKLLQEDDIQGVVIGGIAASILGKPRYTNDVDLVVLDVDKRIAGIIAKLKKYDIEPRISDVEEFAQKSRMLLMRHLPSKINIDISMGLLPFEREAVLRRRTVEFQGVDIPLPTPEDLIIFKSISQRSQDQEDIKDILNRNPRIDKERVLSTVKEFSEIMEKPEIYNKIRSLLT